MILWIVICLLIAAVVYAIKPSGASSWAGVLRFPALILIMLAARHFSTTAFYVLLVLVTGGSIAGAVYEAKRDRAMFAVFVLLSVVCLTCSVLALCWLR